jgi:cytochrome c oxidase cbb3-type subunit III
MKRLAIVCMLACLVLGSACEREARRFVKPLVQPDPRAQVTGDPPLQPGEKGAGMVAAASAGGYSQANAYDVQQGKQWFRWYNCVGCHSHGGGGMGPPLMDSSWIYGSDPDSVFATIMQGRPNGMPSFRGRIPEGQAWQLVAYVRSMSGLGSKQAAPSRADAMEGRKPTPPDTEGGK